MKTDYLQKYNIQDPKEQHVHIPHLKLIIWNALLGLYIITSAVALPVPDTLAQYPTNVFNIISMVVLFLWLMWIPFSIGYELGKKNKTNSSDKP